MQDVEEGGGHNTCMISSHQTQHPAPFIVPQSAVLHTPHTPANNHTTLCSLDAEKRVELPTNIREVSQRPLLKESMNTQY